MRNGYHRCLAWTLRHRLAVVGVAARVCRLAGVDALAWAGLFPAVDAGQFRLHVRAPAGTRIEETERFFSQVEDVIRRTIPAEELALMLDNIGLPVGGVNLAFSDSATMGRGRRDSRRAQTGAPPHLGLYQTTPPDPARTVSAPDILFPVRRYCRANLQFRLPRAH